ncbi:peptidase inhibitor family I36 protein [Streptomyces sp. CA-250714]|uniref:peptidase inhibitor family I36 protein n=1 Tax=Streptomyces sp. CA-250714 TaxID=3240060 RepID=UPI003D929654
MKRTITLTLSALSLAAASLVGFSPAAQADTGANLWERCRHNGKFCLYQHDDFDGNSLESGRDSGCANLRLINNQGSSMINSSNNRVRLYNATNCAGSSGYAARPDSEDKDFTNNGFDNKASSARF